MAKIPVKKLNDGTTNYFPVSVLDSVFLNKDIKVSNTIGGLSKGTTLTTNTPLSSVLNRMLVDTGTDLEKQLNSLATRVAALEGKSGISTTADSVDVFSDGDTVEISNMSDLVTTLKNVLIKLGLPEDAITINSEAFKS